MSSKPTNNPSQKSGKTVTTAKLTWHENGTPISSVYDDVYFSADDGLAESEYVFLANNDLAARWSQDTGQTAKRFRIIETGFGTGLNFLLAAKLWLECSSDRDTLIFTSVEKFPLSIEDLKLAHQQWPQLQALSQRLIDNYPPLTSGLHDIRLFDGRIRLQLGFGDVLEILPSLLESNLKEPCGDPTIKADAWFLDGFAPDKNPDMWSDQLFLCMHRLSHQNTTLATFTAAGFVRRGLKAAGFDVKKVKGFGRKREMIVGQYQGLPYTASLPMQANARHKGLDCPWSMPAKPSAITDKSVSIIGAGLAGCLTAFLLAERGWAVSLLDTHGAPAQEASGNDQGILYNKLSLQDGALAQFSQLSYFWALRFYRELFARQILNDGDDGELNGVLQLCVKPDQQTIQQQLSDNQSFSQNGLHRYYQALDAQQASELLAHQVNEPAIHHPLAGWISPPRLCRALLKHSNISVIKADISALKYEQAQWHLYDDSGQSRLQSSACIIATAAKSHQFAQSQHIQLQPIRGQVSQQTLVNTPVPLKIPVTHAGYVCPPRHGKLNYGASFVLNAESLACNEQEHQDNLSKLQRYLPSYAQQLQFKAGSLTGRAAYRAASRDYLPLAGRLPIEEHFRDQFKALHKNKRAHIPVAGSYHPNLFINAGHGSKGLTSAPICAALITAQLEHEALPLDHTLHQAIHPARFLIREIIRSD